MPTNTAPPWGRGTEQEGHHLCSKQYATCNESSSIMSYRGYNLQTFSQNITTYYVHYREDIYVKKTYRRLPQAGERGDESKLGRKQTRVNNTARCMHAAQLCYTVATTYQLSLKI